jgi:WD40 repeat protein/tRNA A-37 threonylcarbamoyl transferase component Bud32
MIRIEDLVFECLEAGPARDQRLAELCEQHPEHAEPLRRMLADLLELGFLETPGDQAPTTRLPKEVGGYALGELLGRGGMGLVFRARQTSLGDRPVAVKLIRPELVAEPRAEARFLREAMLASKLDHPALCPVLDFGRAEGMPYLVMPLVEGRSLAELLADAKAARTNDRAATLRLPRGDGEAGPWWATVLEMVEKLARGLHYAHEAGLVHRDVKPANVMIKASGDPVLLDFGLARAADQDSDLTRSDEVLGTPAYMAPEQIEPRGRGIDARTDVHALGVLLFECLALRLPHEGATRDELVRRIVADPPSDVVRHTSVPNELRVVLQVALSKEPGQRYASALLFAEDLQRVRTRRPIVARRPGLPARAWRWVQRNPWPTTAGIVLAAGLAVALGLYAQVREQEIQSRALALVGRSQAAADVDQSLALHLAIAAADLAPERLETQDQLHRTVRGMHEVAIVDGFVGDVVAAGFTGDGRTFAVGGDGATVLGGLDGQVTSRGSIGADVELAQPVTVDGAFALVAACRDGGLRLWRPDSATPVALFGPRFEPVAGSLTFGARLAVSRDGRRLLVGSRRGQVLVLTIPGGEVLREVRFDPPFGCGEFAGDEGLVLAGRGGQIESWGRGEAPLRTFQHPAKEAIARIAVDGTGTRFVAMVSGRPRLLAGNLADGTSELLEPQTLGLKELAAAPDGQTFATGANDGAVALWSFGEARPRKLLRGHRATVSALAFAADGRFLLSGAEDRVVRLWDPAGRELGAFPGHHAGIGAVAIDTAHGLIHSGAADATARLWRLADGLPSAEHPQRATESFGRFVFGAEPGVAWIGDSMTGSLWWADWRTGAVKVLAESPKDASCKHLDADAAGRRLLVGRESAVELRDAHTGALLDRLDRSPAALVGVDLTADGLRAVVVEQGGGPRPPRLLVLDVRDDRLVVAREAELDVWDRHLAFLNRADLSADEQTVVVCRMDGTVRLYDLSGRPQSEALDHSRARNVSPYRGTLSRDGTRLLTAGTDGNVKLWARGTSGWQGRILSTFGARVRSAYFDSSERRVVAGSDDGLLRVLDLDGRVLHQFTCPGSAFHCARFAPDDQHVVATTREGRLMTWWLDGDALRHFAPSLQIRSLRADELAAHAGLLGR